MKFYNILLLALVIIALMAYTNLASKSFKRQEIKSPAIELVDADTIIALEESVNDGRFDKAVEIIKKYEGWHGAKHYPYIGYGHRLLKGETLTHNISEETATEILKKDLLQKCEVFREFGKDSLLLATLAYNVGEYKIINADKTPKSMLSKKIASGDRDFKDEYVSYRMAFGRVIKSIEQRRIEEFDALYIP